MVQVKTANAPAAVGPYSQAVSAGGFLFVSGQLPADPATGKIVGSEITGQTHQVFHNLRAILQESRCDFKDVVKVTVFLKSMNDFNQVNEVYAQYFSQGILPARAAVEVSRLPKDVSVEIEAVACLNG